VVEEKPKEPEQPLAPEVVIWKEKAAGLQSELAGLLSETAIERETEAHKAAFHNSNPANQRPENTPADPVSALETAPQHLKMLVAKI